MAHRTVPSHRQAQLNCLVALAVALACVGLLTAATLVPAPPTAVPFLALVCVGLPVFTAWEVPVALAVLRGRRSLRRALDALPETEHPLGY
jgi:O-antigen/teichoic acid export membrane protein